MDLFNFHTNLLNKNSSIRFHCVWQSDHNVKEEQFYQKKYTNSFRQSHSIENYVNYSCEFHTSRDEMKNEKCVLEIGGIENVNKNLHNFNGIHHYNTEILQQTSCRVLHLKSTRKYKKV